MGAFDNIITSAMKTIFTDAIDALLESDALTVPCTVVYGETKWTECSNCLIDIMGQKSSNKYKAGGPRPFTSGICPYCHGRGRIPSNDTETIYLIPLWDYKDWVQWKGSAELSRYPEGYVQTMSAMSTITKIKKAKELLINTDLESYLHNRFSRSGEPTPCGFGSSAYIFTMWKLLS